VREPEDELERLAADALPPGTRVWVTHFFSHFFSTWEQRHTFRAALREAGFGTPGDFQEIGSDEEITGDGYWHHWAFTVLEATAERLTEADAAARAVAAAHGVRYDAWHVQRVGDHVDGKPRIAD
jgi:hypothetical protein